MLRKSAHLQVIPQKNTKNTAKSQLQTCGKNQWTFFIVHYSNYSNNANLGSFANVFVSVQSIIPWSASML